MNLAQLFRHETDLKVLPAGQTLFNHGEQSDLMYVLMSGAMEIIVNNKIVETAETGAIIGEMSMIDNHTHSATVIAKSDCSLLPIDRKRFNFLVQQTPNFALHIMRVMANRLLKINELL